MNKEAKKIIMVVDMVNGFVKKGPMADTYINHITEEIQNEVKDVLLNNGDAIFIRDSHREDAIEFNKFPKHCIKDTWESEEIDELKIYSNDKVNILKNSTCALVNPNFIKLLNEYKNLEEIEIVGCCTDICIYNLAVPLVNYFDEINMNIKVTVPINMVETYDSPIHNREAYNGMALNMMKENGVNVVKGKVLKYEK